VVEPDRELWIRVSPYLDRALELDACDLEPWLAALESARPQLAAELRELLALHARNRASGFMERAPLGPDVSLSGQRIGPYTIERLLGRGGMGSVWLGSRSDGKFEGQAAIKLLERRGLGPGASERIRHEASLLARLSHPHIARLFDAGVGENGQPYLILEYVEGERIDHYCSDRKLSLRERLQLFLDVLEAVAHAHSQLVVHRDLKPSNVLVTADGLVKLLDFGVAALQPKELQRLQSAPVIDPQELTPAYAAPEQIRGEPVSTAADVYSLGVLMHVLVTGTHPYGAADSASTQLAPATLARAPMPASQRVSDAAERRRVRGDLDAIIARALEHDPTRRYASATEFAADIRAHLGKLPVRARPATRIYVAQKFAQRHWGGTLAALLMLLVLVGASVVTTLQMLEARRQRDFARTQLGRAEAINDFNYYLINDVGRAGQPISIRGMLGRAEHLLERQRLNDANRVALLASIGDQYDAEGDHASGLRILNEAYRLSREVSDLSVRARASCALANALAETSPASRASQLLEEGLRELPESAEFALDRHFCLTRATQIARDLGDAELAVRRSEAAIEVLRRVPFAHDLVDVQTTGYLAAALDEAGHSREASATFARGWPRLVALGREDTVGAAIWLNNWAVTLIKLGRPLEAEKLLRRALEMEPPEEAAVPTQLSNYALVLIELKRLNEAANYAERAYRGSGVTNNQIALNQSRLRLARIYREQHDLSRATQMLEEAEASMRQLLPPGHYAFANIPAERALIAGERGEFATALTLIDRAIEIDEQAGQHGKIGAQFLPTLLTQRATIELAAARGPAAEADARKALALLGKDAQPADYSIYSGRAQLTLARALSAQGKAGEARDSAQAAAQQLEKALGPEHPDTRAAREIGGIHEG
jgi:serine/threonine-protein kinase